jgi:excinuclease ABC subunit C
MKAEYRRFNIKDVTPGDDYAALHQAISRRYNRLVKEEKQLPELVIIDGGKGQLKQAEQVFAELKISNVDLMSISKGPGRNPDYDILWHSGHGKAIHLESNSIVLHLIQQIRDEAHRFAITGHKLQRGKKRQHSVLEDIEGVGAKRRRDLLKTFGGLQGLQTASIEQIANVKGIGNVLALKIHQHIH